MRIDRFLHDQQFGTRTQIHEMIKQHRVILNQDVVDSFKQQVNPTTDEVIVDDQPVGMQMDFVYLMNKPIDVITATTDASQKTVMDLFTQDDFRDDLFPVGRLDKDTTGALLITNNGALAHQLVSPKKHVTKVYEVKVTGQLTDSEIAPLTQGLKLKNGEHVIADSAKIIASDLNETVLEIAIHEGKYHQIKRMIGALGQRVNQLNRISFAGLTVADLKLGEYRQLSKDEVAKLLRS